MSGELAKAIGQNDVEAVKALLRQGADINETDPKWGRDMLLLASDRGYAEIAGLLIDAGANVNKVWGTGMTPLMRAALGGRTEVVRLLIAHGADINARSDKGWTAVRHAVNEKKTDVLRLLIESGADVSLADREGIAPQRIAEIHNNALMLQMLEEAPARQQHSLAVRNQRDLKTRAPKPKIIGGPRP
jgi:ankyrin repeat protein